MMYIVKVALFFLFFVQPVLAEERLLPAPFSAKLHTGNFCISEELLVELYQDKNGAVPGKKAGCGKLYIPMDFTVTPVRFLKLD